MTVWTRSVAGLMLAMTASGARAADIGPGAAVPWTTLEAETAKTNGNVLGPDYTGSTPAREASGRRCVRLSGAGEFVEFKATVDAQGLVVRYSIPDTADGKGLDATLSLSINGKAKPKLPLSSKRTYLYGQYPYNNNPASGRPRHFWDELHVMPGTIHAGDVIRIEKQSDDSAAEYLVDFIDLETVPAALENPADSLPVTDFGATADDGSDDRAAFLAAISAGKTQHKTVWIPPGRFVIKGSIELDHVSLCGAGMWYSQLVAADDYSTYNNRISILGAGSDIHLSDFAIAGNLNYRNDEEPNDGLGGSFGSGSSMQNIWVEHTKTGAWITNSDGLTVQGCRFRDTIADGINLCLGMRNTTVQNCTARGGGDDCFAMWPATYAPSTYTAGGNRFVHCTGQLPFLAQAFSIYGGDGNAVEDCAAIDIPYGAGLFASTTFPTVNGFTGTTRYEKIALTRCGCDDGAIGVIANLRDLAGLSFRDIRVIDAPTDGIRFESIKQHRISDTKFQSVDIERVGVGGSGHALAAAPGAVGGAELQDVSFDPPGNVLRDSGFQLVIKPAGAEAAGKPVAEGSVGSIPSVR